MRRFVMLAFAVALGCQFARVVAAQPTPDPERPPGERRDPTSVDPELERALRQPGTSAPSAETPPLLPRHPPLPSIMLRAKLVANQRALALVEFGTRKVVLGRGERVSISLSDGLLLDVTVLALDSTTVKLRVLPHDVEVVVR